MKVKTLTCHICKKKCVLNASEHVYNLVCHLKIKTHGNMPKKCPPTRAGEFIHHGLHTTRNPAVHGPGCRPVVQNISAASRPHGAEGPRVRQCTACIWEELGRGVAAGYINRCGALSLGEVGLNSHHPTAARCAVPCAALPWAQFGRAGPGQPYPRADLIYIFFVFHFLTPKFLFLFIFLVFRIKSLFFYIISNSVY